MDIVLPGRPEYNIFLYEIQYNYSWRRGGPTLRSLLLKSLLTFSTSLSRPPFLMKVT